VAGVVMLGGCARNYRQIRRLQPRDLSGHLFGQSVTEISVFFGVAQVAKGKHRQLDFMGFSVLLSCSRLLPRLEPICQLIAIGVDRAQLVMQVAMDRKPLFFLPALDGTYIAPQITRNLFPGIKSISRIAGGHGFASAAPFAVLIIPHSKSKSGCDSR